MMWKGASASRCWGQLILAGLPIGPQIAADDELAGRDEDELQIENHRHRACS